MPAAARKHFPDPLEYRRFRPEERSALSRFFREAGYPVPVTPDEGWGAWSHDALIGCIALCHEEGVWVLRGPEILHSYRRRRVGAKLLGLAIAELGSRECHCVAYTFLMRMYADAGFKPCPPGEVPRFLARRVKGLREAQWDVTVLRRQS